MNAESQPFEKTKCSLQFSQQPAFIPHHYHHHHHQHHHHHISVTQLGHLLTRSGLTYQEVSSKVCHNSFCHLRNSYFIILGDLLRGILFTCCIHFLLYSSNLSIIGVIFNSFVTCLFVYLITGKSHGKKPISLFGNDTDHGFQ